MPDDDEDEEEDEEEEEEEDDEEIDDDTEVINKLLEADEASVSDEDFAPVISLKKKWSKKNSSLYESVAEIVLLLSSFLLLRFYQ